ncbi:MAG TPA: hypothetical protein VNY83_02605 [Solirubrobacterales bacterium]|nr:hypothetical protein [Solirubrobacterales bacterium]
MLALGVAGLVLAIRQPQAAPHAPRLQLRDALGTLSLTNSKNGQALLSASNMAPGAATSGTVVLEDTGTIGGSLSLTATNLQDVIGSGGQSLSSALVVQVYDTTTGGGPKYSGSLSGLQVEIGLGRLDPGQPHTYKVIATLPSAASNGAQGTQSTVDLTWTLGAIQPPPPTVTSGPQNGTRSPTAGRRWARARILLAAHLRYARLVVRYLTPRPTPMSVAYRVESRRGSGALGTISRRFSRSPQTPTVFYVRVALRPRLKALIQTARFFTVRFRIPHTPPSCKRSLERRLTVPWRFASQLVWFQSDSSFSAAGAQPRAATRARGCW